MDAVPKLLWKQVEVVMKLLSSALLLTLVACNNPAVFDAGSRIAGTAKNGEEGTNPDDVKPGSDGTDKSETDKNPDETKGGTPPVDDPSTPDIDESKQPVDDPSTPNIDESKQPVDNPSTPDIDESKPGENPGSSTGGDKPGTTTPGANDPGDDSEWDDKDPVVTGPGDTNQSGHQSR